MKMKILNPMPGQCPVCQGELHVQQLGCERCGTAIHGAFKHCGFCQLDADQLHFLETFLRCRGVISSVERELGISYPTVRARLDALLLSLGMTPEPDRREEVAAKQKTIMDQLERGELTADEAAKKLRSLR